MMKHLYLFLFFLVFMLISCDSSTPKKEKNDTVEQEIAKTPAQQLLNKCLAYYDPQQQWNSFAAKVGVNTVIYRVQANKKDTVRQERISTVSLDNGNRYFSMERTTDGHQLVRQVIADSLCVSTWAKPNITEKDSASMNLNCAGAADYRNYYRYMIGIPHVLQDAGAIVQDTLFTEQIAGKTYQVITVNYQPIDKEPTWYFYIDPTSYEMVRAKFIKPGKQPNGEIIDLLKPVDFNGMKLFGQLYWMYLDGGRLADDFYTFENFN